MKIHVKTARLTHTSIRNEQEALICQFCSRNIEWTMVHRVQLPMILVVVLPLHLWINQVLKYLSRHIVATILRRTVSQIMRSARLRRIEFKIGLNTVW